ncbi:glycerol-3-phosphate acyltransferase [Alphaproteobacteria bacterium GH1-50]|uniref:Glycerol-3-phosphate acyltransferase n=1 Tax=Kangsaoukella pontilimi TaxID=2691042 RepID=A0A7C9IQS8_9RHOB|nr:1-acyl-sn-glycerol-3-phosphate acyltransferase [Kangsaoukella pontilimi]MXQ09650.1 glycerol-3-phosphate acyltransferase [Kangsaoukella pontilimi]
MTQTVSLPLWLLILILLFAAVTASTHLLFPSVRWFFRRRAERVVARLNERLQRPIQPFKLLRRQDMIQRVIYDPDVVRAVQHYSVDQKVREDVAFEKARHYAREIVPSFSASAYFGFAIRASKWLSTKLFEVRLHRIDVEALEGIDPDATVVFVMNHRSNFDYVLVTYLAASQSALSYAVGEWARVWPLSRLIRAMGAYFIRRRSRNELYRKVLSVYVRRATEAGVTQAVFPEGGLSRNGLVGEPKLGILSYIVEGWHPEGRDVVFVPVSLNYDRVVEDRILVAADRDPNHRFKASAPEAIRFTIRYVRRRIQGKVGRFGVASVTFGCPVSLAEEAAGGGRVVERLARRLTGDIRANVPVLTTPLVAVALVNLDGAGTVQQIGAKMADLLKSVPKTAMVDAVAPDDESALRRELDVLTLRQILTREGEVYRIADDALASYYANSIRQHFDAAAEFPAPLPNGNGKSKKS